jgi:hypothetical protein
LLLRNSNKQYDQDTKEETGSVPARQVVRHTIKNILPLI